MTDELFARWREESQPFGRSSEPELSRGVQHELADKFGIITPYTTNDCWPEWMTCDVQSCAPINHTPR